MCLIFFSWQQILIPDQIKRNLHTKWESDKKTETKEKIIEKFILYRIQVQKLKLFFFPDLLVASLEITLYYFHRSWFIQICFYFLFIFFFISWNNTFYSWHFFLSYLAFHLLHWLQYLSHIIYTRTCSLLEDLEEYYYWFQLLFSIWLYYHYFNSPP